MCVGVGGIFPDDEAGGDCGKEKLRVEIRVKPWEEHPHLDDTECLFVTADGNGD